MQTFQDRHPEVVFVAMSVDDNREAIEKVLTKYQLEHLRTAAAGKQWQARFGLPESIPNTVIIADGRIRVVHNAVIPDAVAYLEADLGALGKPGPVGTGNGRD